MSVNAPVWHCVVLRDTVWHMSVSEEETWSRCRSLPGPPPAQPGPWDLTVKKFSPDPNERFLKMSWGPGPGPRSRQKSSPQEIVTVRYFPDFSRPEVFERERTCKEVENCHRPTLTGSFLSRIPPVEVVGNRLFPQLRSDSSPSIPVPIGNPEKCHSFFAINVFFL